MKITVYSTPTCPYCKLVKEFLNKHNVEFEEIDVSASHEQAQEMIHKSGQMGVPVTAIGEDIVIGFDKPKLKELLNI
ncbi:NrdH-redoxin [Candidatus Uhrbacteria bacterium]|jgi:glutaredoxin-like YruB-family protein|nr:NrdH-redoxin [Candidatus Uhrbacteria bacterium]MBT7717473.1 NrdH-redoxin [Candidatus Uhrbacteria bacterium]